jgi:hypothetical protein
VKGSATPRLRVVADGREGQAAAIASSRRVVGVTPPLACPRLRDQ